MRLGKMPWQEWAKEEKAHIIFRGIVYQPEVKQDNTAFYQGRCRVVGHSGEVDLVFVNEFLAVVREGTLVAATPDIIVALNDETGKPITSEDLCPGQQVTILSLPADHRWYSNEGMKV